MGFEIDPDPENKLPGFNQEPHFGAKIGWGKSPDGEHTGSEPWRFKEKGFKMHAETIKQAALITAINRDLLVRPRVPKLNGRR